MSRYSASAALVAAFLVAMPAAAVDEHHPPGAAGADTGQSAAQAGAPAEAAPAPAGSAGPQAAGAMPCPMMGMMGGGMMPMMGMMGGGAGMGAGAPAGMGMPSPDLSRNVEGRIAFLKAELAITGAQETAWTDFAAALRELGRRAMPTPAAGPAPRAPIEQRLEQREQALAAQLDKAKRLRTAYGKLAAVLTPEQKAAAETLIGPYVATM